jgi:hypothetical protein
VETSSNGDAIGRETPRSTKRRKNPLSPRIARYRREALQAYRDIEDTLGYPPCVTNDRVLFAKVIRGHETVTDFYQVNDIRPRSRRRIAARKALATPKTPKTPKTPDTPDLTERVYHILVTSRTRLMPRDIGSIIAQDGNEHEGITLTHRIWKALNALRAEKRVYRTGANYFRARIVSNRFE